MARRVSWAAFETVHDSESARVGEAASAAAHEIQREHYDLPSAILAELKSLKIRFAVGTIDYWAPCTMTRNERCHLFKSLSAWNVLLSDLCVELRQHPENSMLFSLVDISDSFLITSDEEVLQQGSLLVYCLLKRHRCVTTIEVNGRLLTTHAGVVFAGFRENMRLKKVKILWDEYMPDIFLNSLPSLLFLEELELCAPRARTTDFMQPLSVLITTSSMLRSLDISSLHLNVQDAAVLLSAIIGSRTIKELSFGESVLDSASDTQLEMFQKYLVTNRVLTSLRIRGYFMRDTLFWLLLDCLQKNSTLTHVVLQGVSFNESSARTITTIIERNKILRTFNMQVRDLHPPYERPALYNRWLHSIDHNRTLEEFTVYISIWNEEKWRHFFCSLANKTHWKKLTIEFSADCYRFVRTVQRMLAECEARTKISFKLLNFFERTPRDVTWQCYGLFTNGNEGTCLDILQNSPTAIHVTSAHFIVSIGLLHRTATSVISSFLRTTRALKKLYFRAVSLEAGAFNVDELWTEITESLSGNTTLEELSLHCGDIDHRNLEALAKTVKTSQIHTVHLHTEPFGDYSPFVRALAVGLKGNYKLLSVSLVRGVEGDLAREWTLVRETARRNSGLVTQAAEFASGVRRDRYGARALERMARHNRLLELVADFTSVTSAEAANLIRRALKTFEGLHGFMRLAGVVRGWVECYPRDDGRPQLDNLGDDCWSVIRQYLILEDISDSTEPH